MYAISAILILKLFPKKPAGKPETAVFLLEKPETAGFPKSQDCPQPTVDLVPTLLSAGGPPLALPTAQAG